MKTSKYIKIFTREAEEHLQVLRQEMLSLEKTGYEEEGIRKLMRTAHTLKGSARLLGLNELSQVAHHLEDIFKDLQTSARTLSPELVDLLLMATDALEALVAQADSGGEITVNVDAVVEGLKTGTLPEAAAVMVAPAPEEKKGGLETVRTSVVQLDQMVNLLGELLIVQRMFEERGTQMAQLLKQLEGFLPRLRKSEKYAYLKRILDDFIRLRQDMESDTLNLTYLAGELHREAMELRMLPLSTITGDLARSVRDLARERGKEVNLEIKGEEIELDRMMLEAAKPMLQHMLRNAVDHGIEPPQERARWGKPAAGLIELTARYEGGGAQLVLRDDGRGIDPEGVRKAAVEQRIISEEEAANLSDEEAVYLVLRPGFTTREVITDLSGRGVGMDVVKATLERIKGNLIIHSTPGQGTEMILRFPLTLSLVTGVIADCAGEVYAIPLRFVSEILRLTERDVLTEGGREIIRVRGATIPLVSLQELLHLPKVQSASIKESVTILVLNFREQQLACLVDRSLGVQELVAKGMGQQLKSVEFFSGATILGNGSPALILSVPDVFGASLQARGTHLRRDFEAQKAKAVKGRILVVDDSITTRVMEKNILETQGYEVEMAISGIDALGKIGKAEFDLIVTDVDMPGMTGFELTRKLREMDRTRDVPVIIVTSLASDEDRRMGIEVGAQAYIVKGSFDQGNLLDTVESLVG